MKNRKDILVLILLVICIIGMLVVKYCYEQAVINSTTALILNDILGIPCTVVILYLKSEIKYNNMLFL